MSKIEDGGPAFPTADSEAKANEPGYPTVTVAAANQGMSLRDWFAGQAMTAILPAVAAGNYDLDGEGVLGMQIAKHAYAMADFMITERAALTKASA